MQDKPFSAAAERNSSAILDVLRIELADASAVLEIGSGTGQHAVRFAAAMPTVTWQTSDLEGNHEGIRAWIDAAGLGNLKPPLSLDVMTAELPDVDFDAVFSANTAHIMNPDAVERMFDLVGKVLPDGGRFCLYGPFRQQGQFNADSNAAFDQSLRSQDAGMGIRDIEVLDDLAKENGMTRCRWYAMPANNHIAVWRKASQ